MATILKAIHDYPEEAFGLAVFIVLALGALSRIFKR
jgi:hypothetical protein